MRRQKYKSELVFSVELSVACYESRLVGGILVNHTCPNEFIQAGISRIKATPARMIRSGGDCTEFFKTRPRLTIHLK